MNERLERLIQGLARRKTEVHPSQRLNEDLGLDSLKLIRLAVMVYNEFGVDLGELAEKGARFEKVEDILRHLA